eukprot:TRINITY_DN2056_c0_g1_i1.p2 TRINITY_DN2056_c0_g1~~TRINITY_DN2056_c0_g1_i1.p2  ORF type:complete len:141 (+),score=71.89 TRINITY_DN2056_c0_g1_i1:68-490(+)
MRDLGWTVMYFFLMLEVVIVAALILPMPSNAIRGFLVDSIRKVWAKYPNVQYAFAVALLLDVLLFFDSMNFLNSHGGPGHGHGHGAAHNKIEYFRHQQHAYLTGFSIGLFFVMNRLLDLNTQLFHARQAMKELEKAKKDA